MVSRNLAFAKGWVENTPKRCLGSPEFLGLLQSPVVVVALLFLLSPLAPPSFRRPWHQLLEVAWQCERIFNVVGRWYMLGPIPLRDEWGFGVTIALLVHFYLAASRRRIFRWLGAFNSL